MYTIKDDIHLNHAKTTQTASSPIPRSTLKAPPDNVRGT